MPTIADVAKLAGVSTGTVSRVLNSAENVNAETREKVHQAIAALGYEPNFQARSLRNKRTDTIGLAIPELSNYFWTTIVRGVQDVAQGKGYHVLICNTTGRPSHSLRYLEQMVHRVDGMILSRRSERVIVPSEHEQPVKPIVFVGQSQAESWNLDNVYSDSISGAYGLTQHLIGLGHRNIAIISGRKSSASASDRVAGYCMALADANLPLDTRRIYWGEYERKTAERLTDELIEYLPDTTGIFAANNEIAIGVIRALEKRRISVPEQVAVVCFDDFYPDSRFATFMTVAAQSPYDLGVNAAQLLFQRLNTNEYLRPQTVVLPVRLIVRQSSGGESRDSDPEPAFDNVQGDLISSLSRSRIAALATQVNPVIEFTPPTVEPLMQTSKTQVTIIQRALRHETRGSSPTPHFEYAITGRSLYRYVLERDPNVELCGQTTLISPEDQAEFAQRLGIAAIPCRFPYQPTLVHPHGEQMAFDLPQFTDHLDFFERYVRAARSKNVGIAADFRGIVGDSLRLLNLSGAHGDDRQNGSLQHMADNLLDYTRKIVQLICDRFSSDLAFVIFSDALADDNGLCLPLDMLHSLFRDRLSRLIYPAQEHGLATVLYTLGNIEPLIPLIRQVGFDGVYIAQAEQNDVAGITRLAEGTLSFMGGIPRSLLTEKRKPEDLSTVVAGLSNSHVIVGVSGEVNDEISPGNYVSLVQVLSSVNAQSRTV